MKVKALLVALIAIFAASAVMAQDAPAPTKSVDPYMSVRVYVGQISSDDGSESTSDVVEQLASNSRFGAKFTNDKIKGQFEMGSGMALRILSATYDFGAGTLLIGQDYTPYTKFAPQVSLADRGLLDYGACFDNRRNQITLKTMGLYVSLIEVGKEATGETFLPQIAVGYAFKNDMLEVQPSFTYQSYKDDNKDGESITSYAGMLYAKVNFAPAYIQFNGLYGVNVNEMGGGLARGVEGTAVLQGTEYKDTTTYGGYIAAGASFGKVSVNAGVGYVVSSNDATTWTEDDAAMSYFVNVPIKIEKNFSITPEFAVFDKMKDETDADEDCDTYIGAKFQMDL